MHFIPGFRNVCAKMFIASSAPCVTEICDDFVGRPRSSYLPAIADLRLSVPWRLFPFRETIDSTSSATFLNA